MAQEVRKTYDSSTEKYRRIYCLDKQRLCFLSVFLTKRRELESISFDVEAADDYHYQIHANQLPKLCEILSCGNKEADIVEAFMRKLKTWEDPIEIASFLRKGEIEFQVFHWH